MDLNQQVEAIRSREQFVSFVRALLEDYKRDTSNWENHNLELYLSAVAAWVEDMDGYYQNRGESVPQQPDWKVLGHIMLAAKLYE